MFIRCQILNPGPGPSEQIVGIETKAGQEQVVLSARALINGYLYVGEPLAKEGRMYLVELPRESASGRWRIWVPDSEVSDNSPTMIAAE
jgi:subtilisin-like proprotein convertase family protein